MDNLNEFVLRIPTNKEWVTVWNSLKPAERDKLHWKPYKPHSNAPGDLTMNYNEFHLADEHPTRSGYHAVGGGRIPSEDLEKVAYTSHDNIPCQLRRVLEAMEDISCIEDGTIIQMGNFLFGGSVVPVPQEGEKPFIWPERNKFGGPMFALMPFESSSGTEQISWVKFGNLLMADRPLIDHVTYSQLQEHDLVKGATVHMPFDEAASKYFYEMLHSQPHSPQRRIGEIMDKLERELAVRESLACPDKDSLYQMSLSIHACWCHTDGLELDDVIEHTGSLLANGIEDFRWYKKDVGYEEADFSAEVVESVLKKCPQDVFDQLIALEADLDDISLVIEPYGKITTHSRTLALLRDAERRLEPKPLEDSIQNAKERARKSKSSTSMSREFEH